MIEPKHKNAVQDKNEKKKHYKYFEEKKKRCAESQSSEKLHIKMQYLGLKRVEFEYI